MDGLPWTFRWFGNCEQQELMGTLVRPSKKKDMEEDRSLDIYSRGGTQEEFLRKANDTQRLSGYVASSSA